MPRTPKLLLGIVFSLALAATGLPGQSTTWTGAASSNWGAGGNWSVGVPTSGVDAIIPSGTPNSPSTSGVAGAACRSLTLNAGATLTIAPGFPLDVNLNMTANGTISGTGVLRFVGISFGDVTGASALPNLQVSKSPGATLAMTGAITVNGTLTHTSGIFVVGNFAPSVVTVTGAASFQGGSLTNFNTGTLDIAGNVTFSGTSVVVSFPTIQCGGNWTSDANFAPPAGLVVLDGGGAQTITSATPFPSLTIAPGSSTSAGALTVNGLLTVDGSLTASGTFDANGNVTVGASGSLNVGGGTDTFGGNLTVNGALVASGTFVFDGLLSTDLTGVSPLPNVQVSKSGGAVCATNGALTVNGTLTHTSGTLVVGNFAASVVTVTGAANLQGGSLTHFNTGVLDVGGNVTFSGTSAVVTAPTIRCGGNWISDASFAPTTGVVELDGAGTTTIAHAVAGGALSFPTLVISNGTRTPVNDFTIASSSITIAPGGALAVSGGRHLRVHHPSAATAFNVNGTLSVDANSELSMGPQTTATVGASGSLSLIGTAPQPAKITGEAGGGYALTVNGTIAANQFLVKDMSNAGMVVGPLATIAAAPNNVRNGTFDFRAGAPAGAVLLDLRRQAPAADFDALTFLNTPGAAGVFNVRTDPSGVPISLTNWTGAFAGPTFEDDPNSLIAWNLQAGPTLASFFVVPGAELAEIVWHTTSSANVTGYQVRRANAAAGPFSIFLTTPNIGNNYGFIDSPLPANQAVFYAGYAVMSGGEVLLIGTGSATPYSLATPANVKKVGGGSAFSDIQSAINAATDPNSIVWVTPGNYDSFTIGATAPSNLRILGDGSGPVNVSTANGPIQILNVPASSGVELSNLTVGSAVVPQDGIVITGCAGPVVLDEVDVSCDGTHAAISVSAAPKAAIQRCDIQGGTGLSVSNASYVAISRGSLSSLLSTGSTIEMSTLTPGSVNVSPASSLITRTGLMPEINLPEFVRLSFPDALFLSAQPNAPFVIGASPRLGFQAPTATTTFEMPFLLDPFMLAELPMMVTDGLGAAIVGFEVAPLASLLGFSFTVQVVVGDPVTGTPRLSNVESMVCLP
jgi:hypothetical protein